MQIQKYQWLKEMSTLVCYAYPALILVTFREQGQEGQSTSSDKYSTSCLSEQALSARKDTRQEIVNTLPQWPKCWRGRSPLCLVLLNGSGVLSTSENVMGSMSLYLQDNFLFFPLSYTFSPTWKKPECFTYPLPQFLFVYALLWSVLQRCFVISLQGFEEQFFFLFSF